MRIWIELYDINLVRRVQMGFADEWGAVTGSIGRTICGVSNEKTRQVSWSNEFVL